MPFTRCYRMLWRLLPLTLLLSALAGCAPKEPAVDPFFAKWQDLAATSQGYSPSAETEIVELTSQPVILESAPLAEEPPAQIVPEEDLRLPRTPVSLSVHEVQLPLLLRILARFANQNIVITENIQGKISLNIDNVPWNNIFLGVIRSHGLRYEWEGDIIRIMTHQDLEKDLELQELEEKKQTAQLKTRETVRTLERLEPLETRVVKIRYITDVEKLQENLWKMIESDWKHAGGTASEQNSEVRGAILVDKHTNSLIVQAVPRDTERILETIRVLDRPVRQVLIEARIVEANRDTARELGVQWGGLYRGSQGGSRYWITPGAQTTGETSGSVYQPVNPGSGPAVNFPTPSDIMESGLTLGFLSQSIGEYILDVQLSALQKSGQLNILSSPSITTMDNQEAKISSGQEVPFRTIDSDGQISIIFKNALLELTVTPTLIDDQRLMINIQTSKDELDFSTLVQGNPTILKKNAQTTVILQDGETTVIGGLTKQTDQLGKAGVPWLMNVPGLGRLFQSDASSQVMEDILIFITPHILKERPLPVGAETIHSIEDNRS